ncbi:MAG: tetratricopeptide repeat protein [Actinomycetospora chiangmaiensis]|nr:tetratricopeptide repeat protein [Actinomycetospora chiangmaiensis]
MRSDDEPKKAPASPAAGGAAAALQAKDYSRCLSLVGGAERGGRAGADLLQIKGWCLLGLDRPQEAAQAFNQALPSLQGQKREDSAYGASLALLRTGDTSAAAATASQVPLSASRRNDIGLQVLSQQALAAYQAGRWADAVAALNRRAAYAPETRDLMMLRGWSLFQLYDYEGARQAFTAVDRQLSDHDSQKALATVADRLNTRNR